MKRRYPMPQTSGASRPPAGWTIDDSGMAGLGQAGAGVSEWRGWSFASRDWWVQVAEDQRRSEFLRGTGTVAIADPDEWDDLGDPSSLGTYNSFLRTPPIDISGLRAGSLTLKFDSSFRPEGDQKASVSVSYDGGAPVTVLECVATEDDKTNERVVVPLDNPASAATMVISWGLTDAGNNWFWAIDNISVERTGPLFAEDFNDLPLQDSIAEANAGTGVWTNIPPAGWTIDNSGMFKGVFDPDPAPEDPDEWPGLPEWKGWAFATIEWWPTVDDQRRSEFIKATGVVAIADADEWDDSGAPVAQGGQFNSFLRTPSVSLRGVAPESALLKFDSAWRPECCDDGDGSNNQTATVDVSFDGGPPIRIMEWSSNPDDPTYHADNTNETVLVPVPNPAGARNMQLSFGLTKAANDWFWAVDNIVVTAGSASLISTAAAPGRVVFEISDTGASPIVTGSIALTINGAAAPVTTAVAEGMITVTHLPAVPFAGGSEHGFVLTAVDQTGEPVTFSGIFSVPVPYLPPEPLPGPSGGNGFFGVRYIWGTGGTISGLAEALPAVQSLSDAGFPGLIFDTTHPFINHGDGPGYFAGDESYPAEVESDGAWTDEDSSSSRRAPSGFQNPGTTRSGFTRMTALCSGSGMRGSTG